MAATSSSLSDYLKHQGRVRKRDLSSLLTSEVINGLQKPSKTALSSALECIKGADEESLARILGRGPGGKGAASRVLVLALLHLTTRSSQQQNGHSSSSFGAVAGNSSFVLQFEEELQRMSSLIAGVHGALLERLADLGRQLPPVSATTPGSRDADRVQPPHHHQPVPQYQSSGELLAALHRLQYAADQVAADLVAADDCLRDAVEALAHLAVAYDDALIEAAAASVAVDSSCGDGGQQQQLGRSAPALPAVSGSLPPLTAVRSHSAPGPQGKYIAGEFV